MALILICVQDNIRGQFHGESFTFYDHVYLFEQLQAVDLVLVQKDTKGWDISGKYENGLHFIEELRLEKGCELPFVVIEPEPQLQTELDNRVELYEDPYIRRVYFSDIEKFRSPDSLFQCFNLSISKDEKQMLFQDIRQTIYRQEGFIDELRHRVMRVFDHVVDYHNLTQEKKEETERYMQQAYNQVKKWCPGQDMGPTPKQLLNEIVKSDIGTWFEKLSEIVQKSKYKRSESEQELVDKKVLYISDSADNREKLITRFEKTYEHYHITCTGAKSLEDALHDIGDDENKIISVVTDFRFRDEDGRIALRNGYSIINALRKKFPDWQYLMLTNYPVKENGTLPIPKGVEIFSKSQVFNTQSRAFASLASQIISFHAEASLKEDKWPVILNSEDDKVWRDYFQKFVRSADFQERERKLGDKAKEAINNLIKGEPAEVPNHGVRLYECIQRWQKSNKNKNSEFEAWVMEKLFDMLLIRRIYIGLFQLNITNFPREMARVTKKAYDIVNARNDKKQKVLDNAALSNYFTKIRLLTNINYRVDDERMSYITLAERRWLARNYEWLSSLK